MILKAGIDNLIIKMDRKEAEILAEALRKTYLTIDWKRDPKEIEDFSNSSEFQTMRKFAVDLYFLPF